MQVFLNLLTAALLAVIAWTDYHTMEIPDGLNLTLGLCALAAVPVFPEIALMQRCVGAFCVFIPMFLLCLVIDDAFGGGDLKLVFVMGFYLGWRACLAGVFIGFLIGGLQAAFLLVSGRARYGERTHMAFGPALCAGFLVALIYGRQLFDWYFGLWI